MFLSEYSGLPKDSQLDWQTLYFREELKCLALWRISSLGEGVVLQNSYPAYSSSVTFACHSKVITDLKNSSPQQISPEDVSITSSNRGKDQYFIYNWELEICHELLWNYWTNQKVIKWKPLKLNLRMSIMAFYGVFLMWWWCNTKTKENLHSIQQSMKIYLVSARLAIWENRNSHDTLRYRTAVITHKNPTWKICRSKLPHFQHTLKIAKKKVRFSCLASRKL